MRVGYALFEQLVLDGCLTGIGAWPRKVCRWRPRRSSRQRHTASTYSVPRTEASTDRLRERLASRQRESLAQRSRARVCPHCEDLRTRSVRPITTIDFDAEEA